MVTDLDAALGINPVSLYPWRPTTRHADDALIAEVGGLELVWFGDRATLERAPRHRTYLRAQPADQDISVARFLFDYPTVYAKRHAGGWTVWLATSNDPRSTKWDVRRHYDDQLTAMTAVHRLVTKWNSLARLDGEAMAADLRDL